MCFGRYCHLLPNDVREWFWALGQAQAAGVPFHEARDELEKLGLNAALAEWREAVKKANGVGR